MPGPSKMNRVGEKYGKLLVLRLEEGRWRCLCTCGNEVDVLSTNLSNYARNNRGCRNCCNRKNIIGEKVGLLTAECIETGTVKGRNPLWTFRCDCDNTIQGTVREFHAQQLRSCGCHDCAWSSWISMMSRCYNPKNNRYNSYGARGIKVEKRWHQFENFIADMGERPKRHNLGRKHAEKNYGPGNCKWEHVSMNCRDTNNNGTPTKPGLLKGAKIRRANVVEPE